MKFMMVMRVTEQAEAESAGTPFNELVERMGRYNESLMKAGVLLAAEGLAPAEEGFVVDFGLEPPAITDGPFAEARHLFHGFWILQTPTRQEAEEWASRCPLGPGARLEVRRVAELAEVDSDSEPGAEAVEHAGKTEQVIQW